MIIPTDEVIDIMKVVSHQEGCTVVDTGHGCSCDRPYRQMDAMNSLFGEVDAKSRPS